MEHCVERPVVTAFFMVEHGSFKVTIKRLAGVHKVLYIAREIACEGHEEFHWESDGGFMITVNSNIGQEMWIHFERLLNSSLHRRQNLQCCT